MYVKCRKIKQTLSAVIVQTTHRSRVSRFANNNLTPVLSSYLLRDLYHNKHTLSGRPRSWPTGTLFYTLQNAKHISKKLYSRFGIKALQGRNINIVNNQISSVNLLVFVYSGSQHFHCKRDLEADHPKCVVTKCRWPPLLRER